MSHTSQTELSRLKTVLFADKAGVSTNLSEVVKSDLFKVISNYLDINKKYFSASIEFKDGMYSLTIIAKGDRIKPTISI